MLLFRALNNFDILADPIENGIASKEVLYSLTKIHYENNHESNFSNLNKQEKDIFIKENIENFIKKYNNKLERLYKKYTKNTKETVNAIIKNHNPGSLILFKQYISTLQKHLTNGSRTYTDWISTSKDISSVMKYYDRQYIHSIAVIKSDTNGIIDSKHNIIVDISSKEKIENNPFLCNKIECDYVEEIAYLSTMYPSLVQDFNFDYVVPTDTNARSFNYSIASNEVCVFKHITSANIVSVLESLQIDLLSKKIFDIEYLKLNKSEQKAELRKLKTELLRLIRKMNDSYLLHLYEELYLENKNIDDLVTLTESKDKIIYNKNKILRLAQTIPNIQIKH